MSDLSQSVAAIVVTYNSADVIGECVGSIRRFLPNAEIVVVNNGPDDGTSAEARAAADDVSVISGHGNIGFGAACNLGVAESSKERQLLLFLNPDAVVRSVDEGSLRDLTAKTQFIAALNQSDSATSPIRGEAGPFGIWWRETFNHFLKPRSWSSQQPNPAGLAPWVGFSAVVMDRATFNQVGGFSDLFFVYFEDRDLCRRARQHGVAITESQALVVSHAGSEGSDIDTTERTVLSQLGMLQYLTVSRGKPAGQAAGIASVAVLALLEATLLLRFLLPSNLKSRLDEKSSQAAATRKASAGFLRVAGQPEASRPPMSARATAGPAS